MKYDYDILIYLCNLSTFYLELNLISLLTFRIHHTNCSSKRDIHVKSRDLSLAPETAGGAAMFGATGQPGGMFAAGGGGGLSASQAAKKCVKVSDCFQSLKYIEN